jgi:hypothetical protein
MHISGLAFDRYGWAAVFVDSYFPRLCTKKVHDELGERNTNVNSDTALKTLQQTQQPEEIVT